jgi:hypothetical protein
MMRMPFEKPASRPATPAQWLADFGGHYALSALVGFLFACTGPVAIILATGARGERSGSGLHKCIKHYRAKVENCVFPLWRAEQLHSMWGCRP